MIQIQNAQETGDPQADAFRQAGFEQELCRLVASNEIGGPLPPRELRYRPVKFAFTRTGSGRSPRRQTWKDRWWRCFRKPSEV